MPPRRYFPVFCRAVVFFTLIALLPLPAAHAQTRINDKDMASLMKNLRDDAKNFPPSFKSALHKSVIRNTSEEKNAKELADQFEKETDEMWKRFKSKKKADTELRQVMDTAEKLDKLVYSLRLDDKAITSWEIVRSALQEVAGGYGVSPRDLESNGE